jgi:hypothetical protein
VTTVAEPAAPPGALQPDRPDVFVSYSRRDKEFVEKLLLAELVGKEKDVWIDLQDIPPAADWRDRVWRGIEAAKAFMFVLSPDSVTSKICLDELERAVEQNKRLIPAVRRDVDPERVPAALERPNWIWLRDGDDFGEQFAQVVEALETDLDWRDMHARLGARANEWKRAGDDTSFLLRGNDLDGAERWLADQAEHKERATPLQSEYIVASRRAAARRQRLTLTAVAAALAISIGLTIFALLQRSAAIDREKVARSRELAASASAQLPADPELSALLAREAARISPTDQAENALRIALGQTHVHSVLSSGAGAVWAADFSSKGDFVVTASSDRRVRVWDARSGRLAAKLQGHRFVPGETSVSPRYPVIAAFGPHDDHLVTAGDDGTVQVWDWRAERTMFRLTGRGPFVTTALLSPDGDDLLVGIGGAGGTAELWDWKLRRRVAQLGDTVGAEADVFGVEDAASATMGG